MGSYKKNAELFARPLEYCIGQTKKSNASSIAMKIELSLEYCLTKAKSERLKKS